LINSSVHVRLMSKVQNIV